MTNTDILVINGPNLNRLGTRQPEIYGYQTLADAEASAAKLCTELGRTQKWMQSNSEGEIIHAIQQAATKNSPHATQAIIINAAGYSHSSIAIRDALCLHDGPKIEVHISNIYQREEFRHVSYLTDICDGIIAGLGVNSYLLAIRALHQLLDTTTPHTTK